MMNLLNPAMIAAQARRQALSGALGDVGTAASGMTPQARTAVQPQRLVAPEQNAPAGSAPTASAQQPSAVPPPAYGGKSGAALARDPSYIRDQVNKGYRQKFGVDAPEDVQKQWYGYAMRPDVYSDKKIRVGWNDYLYDRLATPGSEGSSSVAPGDDTVVGMYTGLDSPMTGGGSLDPGAGAAGGDNAMIRDILAQLGDSGARLPSLPQAVQDETGAATQFSRSDDALRRRARRDVYSGVL